MSDEIIKVLDALCEKLGVVVDWTGETVLPQIQELGAKCVNYELVTSIALVVLFGVLLVIGVSMTIFGVNLLVDDGEDFGGCLMTAGVILTFAIAVITVFEVGDIITCNVFPEKIIYEFISDALN